MNESEYQALREAGWRRPLKPAEEARLLAWLGAHPEKQAEWEADAALNQLLGQLPDAPVPSNFTARVLQEATCETAAPGPSALADWLARIWRRPAAVWASAAAVVLAGWLGYVQIDKHTQPEHSGDIVVLINAVGSRPVVFEDFDAIRKLPRADDEDLYAVLSVQP